MEQSGGKRSTEIFVSNVATTVRKFIYYTCSSRCRNYDSDGNGDDDKALDGRYGSDRRTWMMVNGMNKSTDHGRDNNISIKRIRRWSQFINTVRGSS